MFGDIRNQDLFRIITLNQFQPKKKSEDLLSVDLKGNGTKKRIGSMKN